MGSALISPPSSSNIRPVNATSPGVNGQRCPSPWAPQHAIYPQLCSRQHQCEHPVTARRAEILITPARRRTRLFQSTLLLVGIVALLSAAGCSGAGFNSYDTGVEVAAADFDEAAARRTFLRALSDICRADQRGVSTEMARSMRSVEIASVTHTSPTWTFTTSGKSVRIHGDGVVEGDLLKELTSLC